VVRLRTWYLGERKEGQVGEAQPWEEVVVGVDMLMIL
jgi:hypothetical protein